MLGDGVQQAGRSADVRRVQHGRGGRWRRGGQVEDDVRPGVGQRPVQRLVVEQVAYEMADAGILV
jgi:hypothetical protein